MSDKSPEDVHKYLLKRLKESDLADDTDRRRLREMDAKYDEENFAADCPPEEVTKSIGTRNAYLKKLIPLAERHPLTELSADDWNHLMMDMKDGRAEEVKDSGLSSSTIRLYQNALRAFLKTVDQGANPEDVALAKQDDTPIDPEDMLTKEDIREVRKNATNVRNLALFDFFVYTGQRNTAARTLRIKDLRLEENKFKLNTEASGLKGADEKGKWRSLLLSESTIRQWLHTGHPAPDDDQAYLFLPLPRYSNVNPREPISSAAVGTAMRTLKENAGIEKPMHPHALRHTFVTIAHRRGMNEAAIKHQIGHAPDSTVMETTYSHLDDEDFIKEARASFGLETETEESVLTPEICPRCGHSPDRYDNLCANCGLPFSPGVRSTRKSVEEAIFEDAKRFDDDEIHEALDDLRDLLAKNPGLLDTLTDDE